jgi:hypothetical protein
MEEYKIRKRRAIKIEELPALQEGPKEEQEHRSRIKPLIHGVYENFTYTNYEWSKSKNKGRLCVLCSHSAAQYMVYYQQNGFQLVEKLCQSCLDKWVYVDETTILIEKFYQVNKKDNV